MALEGYNIAYSVVDELIPEDDILGEDELEHYGMSRRSGRYPWGSGENPYQRTGYFRRGLSEMRSQGMSDKEIMQAMGMSSTEFRQMNSLAKDAKRAEYIAEIQRLKDQGLSNVEIGKRMDPPIGESQVRNLLTANASERASMSPMLLKSRWRQRSILMSAMLRSVN